MRTKEFVNFIKVREAARVGHDANEPKPWVKDLIIQKYRFCNVRREDDKVTRWIAKYWRAPLSELDSPNLWFWMLVARLVNNPETLNLMSMVLNDKWSEREFIKAIRTRMRNGEKAWGGAYIVSTNGNKMEKSSYIAEHALTPAWKRRKEIQPRHGEDLKEFCRRLLTLNGVQGFIAGQVIADAKYADPYLRTAWDWQTFAISGPGSCRGLNRVVGRALNEPWREQHWHDELSALRTETNKRLVPPWENGLHAQDIQNCLCEFDKYERVRLGEGKPRSTYPGV